MANSAVEGFEPSFALLIKNFVVLNFIAGGNGRIGSIKILRSPGKIFSDMAIRPIKEGPDWKPAEENGKVISDEVRIRIVFK